MGVTPFDWSRDYRPAFDACPSAFWLAPDAADTLPAADLLTPRPVPARPDPKDTDVAAWTVDNRAVGSSLAIVAAGPIFAASASIAMQPDASGLTQALGSLMLFPLTMLVGVMLSALPIWLGTLMMGWLGERFPIARHLLAWTGAGALFGGALGGLFGETPLSVAIMAATGAACAAISRWKIRWIPGDQPFSESPRTPAVAISA